jgi:hypothetical protein
MESFPLMRPIVRANGSPRTMRRFSRPDSPWRAGAAADFPTCTAATHRCAPPGMPAPCATTRLGSTVAALPSMKSRYLSESRRCGIHHRSACHKVDCRSPDKTANTLRSRIRSPPAVRIAMAMPVSAALVPEPACLPAGRRRHLDETGKQGDGKTGGAQ